MSDVLNVSEIFGKNVFNDAVMKDRLPKNVYKKLKKTVEDGAELDPSIADVVAHAMKDWAIERGATHYTHWFQPLTGVTAEKHDSFISAPSDGKVIMEFSGKELIKGEPDASSFPSGGLRATFEARGYTVWDCTSPAFLREDAIGVTLCIPTSFCSYKGEALDKKTPLLRSMQAVNEQALRILRLFGNTTARRVAPSVGAEQEYFLVDREKYLQRKDLIYTGRTLFGAMPPKGQELEDHYFGAIRERIGSYMNDVNKELWKLGVPAKTQHNEVAPAQHELAPIYEGVNQAVDHNQIVMETLKKVAGRHGMACLLHEKPFAGVNGSGKHNNWSLTADDGTNLLNPGDTPHENIQFLLVLACIIKAVDLHADLLRESAADVGNDHRLGANEAPPAIISVFLGEQLTSILESIAHGDQPDATPTSVLQMGVETLPKLQKDDSDRNRTSPFAFTGNKFEFRMVGSSASIAFANYVLNTIVADTLMQFADRLEKTADFDAEVTAIIRETMTEHGRVIFNGNNYTKEWVEEAQRRGLPNLTNTVDASKAYIAPKNMEVLERHHVLSAVECHARYEIMLENYSKVISIEANTMLEMVKKQIIPACIAYIGKVSHSYNELKAAGISNASMKKLLEDLSGLFSSISVATKELEKLENIPSKNDSFEEASYCKDIILPQMEKLRKQVDRMEMLVSSEDWPMPSYTDLLHRV